MINHAEQVENSKLSVIHWDFHPQIVIDWTGLEISDPRFDLAWTLMLVQIYEGIEWWRQILTSCELHDGNPVEMLDFFDAAACLRRLNSIAVSTTAGAEHMGMRPGAEKIMQTQIEPIRAVCELLHQRTGLRILLVENWFS